MSGNLTFATAIKTANNPGGPNPTHVSSTGFASPASNATSWTPFTALDLSNCNLAVLVISSDGTPTLTTSSSGWVKLGQTSASASPTTAIFYKLSPTASETFALASSGSEQYSAVLVRVNNTTNISGTGVGAAASANADPPSHNAGAARNHLWIAVGGWDDIITASGAPSGYSNLTTATAAGASGASSAAATKFLNAQTEDPGGFTSASETWVTYTLSIWNAA